MARAGTAGRLAGKSAPAVAGKHFLSLCQGGSLIIIYPPQAAQRPAKEQHGAGARAQPGGQESWTVVSALPHAVSPDPATAISSLFLSGNVRGMRLWEELVLRASGPLADGLGCQLSRGNHGQPMASRRQT